MSEPVIAIDGAAGSGKSTLARALARELGLAYVNTGLMYRALAALARERGVNPGDADALMELMPGLRFTVLGNDPPELEVEGFPEADLLALEVERTVSEVASHRVVRAWMRDRQRQLGGVGAVIEGRDIGSVVFPDAAVKFVLVADQQARGRRRAKERPAGEAETARDLQERDRRDHRTVPLDRPPADAVVLDTGKLDVPATIRAALHAILERAPELLP